MCSDSPDHESRRRLTSRQHLALLGVFLLALLVRAVYLWGQAENNPTFAWPLQDCKAHHDWAQQIVAGEGMGSTPFFRAPLYYYLLALFYQLFGPGIAAAKIASILLGSATCYLIARLGNHLAGFATALVAGLLAALYWPFIYFDSHLLSVGLESFLNVAFLFTLLIAVKRESLPLFLAAGIVWGLSAITRPVVLAITPGIVIWIWFVVGGRAQGKRWLLTCAALGLGGALAVLPVTIRNWTVGGEGVLIATNGGVNFYIGNNPHTNGYTAIVPGTRGDWEGGYEDTHRIAEEALGCRLDESEVSAYWFDRGVDWIASEPGAWVSLLGKKLRLFWTPVEISNNAPIRFFADLAPISALFWIGFPVVVLLAAAALVVLRDNRRSWALLGIFAAMYMVTVVAFFVPGRFRLPALPILILFAAGGLTALPRLVREQRHRRLGGYVLVAIATVFALGANFPERHAGQAIYDQWWGHFILAHNGLQRSAEEPELFEEALEHYRLAIEAMPKMTDTPVALIGAGGTRPGGIAKAIAILQDSLDGHPDNLPLLTALAPALFRERRFEEAIDGYAAIDRLGALSPPLRFEYARSLRLGGLRREAIDLLEEGVRSDAAISSFRIELAWLLATAPEDRLRNGSRALRLVRQVIAATMQPSAQALDTLAAAHAELGNFEEARRIVGRALGAARQEGRGDLEAGIRERVKLYAEGRPFRE
jgi:4-amino-4-deoxy-L-arabinose transferase-like glycosyltransferase